MANDVDPFAHIDAAQPAADPFGHIDAPGPAKPMMGAAARIGTGMKDPVVGGAQLLRNVTPDFIAKPLDRLNDYLGMGALPTNANVQAREADIAATTPSGARSETTLDDQGRPSHQPAKAVGGADPLRMLGQTLSPINYLGAAAKSPMVAGALMGATTGATTPVDKGQFWPEKAKQVVVGGAVGSVLGAAGSAIGPAFRADAQKLLDAGVLLTPGQMAGRIPRRTEEAAKSLPITGMFIRGAEMRTMDSFNRATVNRALDPLGVKVAGDLHGHDLIAAGQRALDDAYHSILPNMNFDMAKDPGFVTAEQNLISLTRSMPAPQVQQFDQLLRDRVATRLAPTGTAHGETIKQVDSELGHVASEYMRSPDPGHREYGTAVAELRNIIRDSLKRQNPAYADKLDAADAAYAMMVRIEGAAARRPTSAGRFTPSDLLASVKASDKSVRKRRFARGDALLQDWGDSAQEVIGNHMPDSGTTERAAYDVLGGGGVLFAEPHIAAGLAAASAPYTKPAQAALNVWANPAGWRQSAAQFVNRTAPLAAPGAAVAATTGMTP